MTTHPSSRKGTTTPFGAYLRRERIRAKRDLAYVAERLGVTRVYLSMVERGVRAPFGPARWPALKKALPGLSLTTLRSLAPLTLVALTDAERRLAIVLLRRAAEAFGRNSCNDFDLVRDAGLTPAESFQIRRAEFALDADASACDRPTQGDHRVGDFFMMDYLARRLEGEP